MTDTVQTASTPTTPAAVKPGWQTTEGWINFLTACLGAAATTHLVGDGSPIVTLGGMALMMISAAVHTWSRTAVKVAAS